MRQNLDPYPVPDPVLPTYILGFVEKKKSNFFGENNNFLYKIFLKLYKETMAPEELLVESLNGEFMLDPDPQHCFFLQIFDLLL